MSKGIGETLISPSAAFAVPCPVTFCPKPPDGGLFRPVYFKCTFYTLECKKYKKDKNSTLTGQK
jgi:hypothetical protein